MSSISHMLVEPEALSWSNLSKGKAQRSADFCKHSRISWTSRDSLRTYNIYSEENSAKFSRRFSASNSAHPLDPFRFGNLHIQPQVSTSCDTLAKELYPSTSSNVEVSLASPLFLAYIDDSSVSGEARDTVSHLNGSNDSSHIASGTHDDTLTDRDLCSEEENAEVWASGTSSCSNATTTSGSSTSSSATSGTSSSDSGSSTLQRLNPLSAWSAIKSLVDRVSDRFSPRIKGLFLLNILTFLYGSNVSVIREAEGSLDAFTFSAGRLIIAALAFSPNLLPALRSPAVRRAGFELGTWISIAYIVQAVGLLTTEAGRAAFIGTFTVIEVPIIAGMFGAQIPLVTWLSAAAAVVGVGMLESSSGLSSLDGDLWTFASAILFGIHMLRSEHHARLLPPGQGLTLMSLQLAVTATLSTVWVLFMRSVGFPVEGVDSLLSLDFQAVAHWPWLQMVYTGLISTAFCLWVEIVSLRDVSAAEAAMVYTLEPLYGAGLAWLILGETLGPSSWLGAAFILGGSLSMQLYGKVDDLPPDDSTSEESPTALPIALTVAATTALIMAATVPPNANIVAKALTLQNTEVVRSIK